MMEKIDRMITTEDNPFDPFTQWREWSEYDENNGYFTNQYLARLVTERLNPRSSDMDIDVATIEAMDEMMDVSLLPYKFVYPSQEE